MSATWRLLIEDVPPTGARNMARDRAVQLAHARGLVPPTLTLYRWARPTVTLGRFQSPDDVDLPLCDKLGLDVVRRFTGGRGVLHDDEVTYSVVAGLDDGIPRGVAASYRAISGMLLGAYRSLGVPAEMTARPRGRSGSAACYLHATHADLSVGTAKLSGSAQVWHEGSVLQHGSVVRTRDSALEAQIFRLGAGGAAQLDADTATLVGLLGRSPSDDELRGALVEGLERAFGVRARRGELTRDEVELSRDVGDFVCVNGRPGVEGSGD